MDQRKEELGIWVAGVLNLSEVSLSVVSGDASFRRYFRLTLPSLDSSDSSNSSLSLIAMDAPPEKEDSSSFVAIAQDWFQKGIAVPEIKALDLEKGFLLLSDLGDDLLLDRLCPENPQLEQGDKYYQQAITTLLKIQQLDAPENYVLPPYDSALLQREMALFPDWLVANKLGLRLDAGELALLADSFKKLEETALAQRQVLVHRDYHARNLMVLKDDSLGVIDFQDAVLGPVSYDLVSMLRDCYIVWPDEKVDQWCHYFYQGLSQQQDIKIDYARFKKDFDFMGLQRHLKAAGIFARLSLRDGKHAYLADIPRTVAYIVRISQLYPELAEFHAFLVKRVQPCLEKACAVDSAQHIGTAQEIESDQETARGLEIDSGLLAGKA